MAPAILPKMAVEGPGWLTAPLFCVAVAGVLSLLPVLPPRLPPLPPLEFAWPGFVWPLLGAVVAGCCADGGCVLLAGGALPPRSQALSSRLLTTNKTTITECDHRRPALREPRNVPITEYLQEI